MEEQERPRSPSEQLAIVLLQALSALHLEVISQYEENRLAYDRFMHMSHLRRKHHLVWRSTVLQGIHGFWDKAVSFLLLLGVFLTVRAVFSSRASSVPVSAANYVSQFLYPQRSCPGDFILPLLSARFLGCRHLFPCRTF